MESPIFNDDKNISLVTYRDKDHKNNHDDDYDDCNAPIISKRSDTTPMTTRSTYKEASLTLPLTQV